MLAYLLLWREEGQVQAEEGGLQEEGGEPILDTCSISNSISRVSTSSRGLARQLEPQVQQQLAATSPLEVQAVLPQAPLASQAPAQAW